MCGTNIKRKSEKDPDRCENRGPDPAVVTCQSDLLTQASIMSLAISLSLCSRCLANSGCGQWRSSTNICRASSFQNRSSEVAEPLLQEGLTVLLTECHNNTHFTWTRCVFQQGWGIFFDAHLFHQIVLVLDFSQEGLIAFDVMLYVWCYFKLLLGEHVCFYTFGATF